MPEWFWISVCATLALLLLYSTFSRRSHEATPSPAAPPDKTEKKEAKSDRPSATTKAKEEAARTPAPDAKPAKELPKLDYEEDADVDPTKVGGATAARPPTALQPPTKKIVYDEDAAQDEPTHAGALILVTATAQTDKGLRRKRNEDSVLALPEHGVFVVADGMGGYRGGEIASALAVTTIAGAFKEQSFAGEPHENIPSRASELARAIQMANDAILSHAEKERELAGMGTTICAVRFSPNKQRLYIAHVGDSRMYRVRGDDLKQMTADHTMKDLGVTGPTAAHLSRAVGVWPTVPIDILLGKPKPKDLYILCSDGLTKMVPDKEIHELVAGKTDPAEIVKALIDAANAHGGKDNVSVIVIRVVDPATGA